MRTQATVIAALLASVGAVTLRESAQESPDCPESTEVFSNNEWSSYSSAGLA